MVSAPRRPGRAPMHVGFICDEYPPARPGGVGSFTQSLGRALVARGHRVTVVGQYRIPRRVDEVDEGVRVIRLPHVELRGSGFVQRVLRVRAALAEVHRARPLDVLEGPSGGLASVPRGLPVPTVLRMHGGHHFFRSTLGEPLSAWRCWLERRAFARADHLCAVSAFVGETMRGLLRLGDRPIEVIPNGVDLAAFRPRPDVTPEPGTIAYVGGLVAKKGVRELVRAMPQVLAAVPHATLWLVGGDRPDPRTGASLRAALEREVPPEHADRVLFRGAVPRDEVPGLLARAEVCVYPSHMEAHPIAWLEGLAMGKPVVASRTGPGPEVVEDGVSGVLCDPHDPAAISAALVRTLGDAALRERLGRAARARAEACYDLGMLAERNEEYFRRCARQGGRGRTGECRVAAA